MSSKPAATESTAIRMRLSKDQVAMIWQGLNYILSQFVILRQTGQAESSYPFRILPLPRGFDSGTFSNQMMDRIAQLGVTVQPVRKSGGTIWLDSFDLRAAIFAARTNTKIRRTKIRTAKKRGAAAQRRVAAARQALKQDVRRKKRLVELLERVMKRANRLFKSVASPEEFKIRSDEWQAHLRWIKYHLTYFKPLPRPATAVGKLKLRRAWLATLEQVARKAIVAQGFVLPDPADLRRVLRLFLDYSLRGRIGKVDHIYITRRSESPVAQAKVFDFVRKRLVLKEAIVTKPIKESKPAARKSRPKAHKGRPKQTAHRTALRVSEVQQLIRELRKRWTKASGEELRTKITVLLDKGCSIRGLAKELNRSATAIRNCVNPAPALPKKEKPQSLRAAVPVGGSSIQAAAAPVQEMQVPSPSKEKPVGTRQQVAPSGTPLQTNAPPRASQQTETEAPDQNRDQNEENLESLRLRLTEIIVDFIRAKVGQPDSAVMKARIHGLFAGLRQWSRRQPPHIYPRHLPARMTLGQLYQYTGVNFTKEQPSAAELGEWLAVLLASLAPRSHPDPRTSPWEPEIEQAERQLLGEPKQGGSAPQSPALQGRSPSVRITTTGFSDRNRSRVPSRTDFLRRKP